MKFKFTLTLFICIFVLVFIIINFTSLKITTSSKYVKTINSANWSQVYFVVDEKFHNDSFILLLTYTGEENVENVDITFRTLKGNRLSPISFQGPEGSNIVNINEGIFTESFLSTKEWSDIHSIIIKWSDGIETHEEIVKPN
ncbi:hypothetical protein [Marinicrinis lubricantis]|uniref:Uncharacterized protein n=1 Tax=Marinicrinis lubricantis TaxID=2086470 RepID=A0ABW1IVW5_9BACL